MGEAWLRGNQLEREISKVHLNRGRISEGIWQHARKGTGAEGFKSDFGVEPVVVLSAAWIRKSSGVWRRFRRAGHSGKLLIAIAVGLVLAAVSVEGGWGL